MKAEPRSYEKTMEEGARGRLKRVSVNASPLPFIFIRSFTVGTRSDFVLHNS